MSCSKVLTNFVTVLKDLKSFHRYLNNNLNGHMKVSLILNTVSSQISCSLIFYHFSAFDPVLWQSFSIPALVSSFLCTSLYWLLQRYTLRRRYTTATLISCFCTPEICDVGQSETLCASISLIYLFGGGFQKVDEIHCCAEALCHRYQFVSFKNPSNWRHPAFLL